VPLHRIHDIVGIFVLLSSLQFKLISSAELVASALHRHPRRVAGTVGTVLLGAASFAFGVASVEKSAPDITQRQVLETVAVVDIAEQRAALEAHSFRLFRSETIRNTDTAETLLSRLNISDPAAAAFLRGDAKVRQHLLGKAGRTLQAEAGDDQSLQSLTSRWANDDQTFSRLVVTRDAIGLRSRVDTAPLVPSTRIASGVVRSTLFAATDDANVPDAVAKQMLELFSADIDFHRALRKGDRFSMVYETLNGDGEPLKSGRLLSAEFVNAGRLSQAMWFQEPGSKGQYFGFDGQSLKRAFLASPLEFSRVTSGFGMRNHPIARDWRQHKGVDYSAPTGTPVRTVGDGVVEFAGVQSGYGNVIEIKHRDGKSTLFAHLSRIDVKKGQRVEQGDLIGAVGSTGWSTGPHLHFEFRVNGEHQDPMTLARQAESAVVSGAAKRVFEGQAQQQKTLLASASLVQPARAQ
jgi:murein DD-endopeptidase MepM/ murein hydrolase activator NlpD